MYKVVLLLALIVLFVVRWVGMDSPIPESWTPESRIRFTARLYERPEYTDSKTIIRHGIWYIPITGYAEIMSGDVIRVVGKIEPKVLGGKPTRIVMVDPILEEVESENRKQEYQISNLLIVISRLRDKWVGILEKVLPEPMSSLAAGILLGVKAQIPYDFYRQLVATGTMHIVAASGYNVTVLASVIMKVLSRIASRGIAIGGGIVGIILYVILAGASASVVRAGIMGSLTLIAYYYGRPTEAKRLLWISAGVMLIANPLMLVDIGFQLSVLATAGLLYIPFNNQSPNSNNQTNGAKIQNNKILNGVRKFLADYLYPTLAASIATLPIILYHFGRVAWISPIANILILPVVPLIMLLSALTLLIGQPMAWIAYVPLAWMVWVIRWLG